jgi:hypothetical protein
MVPENKRAWQYKEFVVVVQEAAFKDRDRKRKKTWARVKGIKTHSYCQSNIVLSFYEKKYRATTL